MVKGGQKGKSKTKRFRSEVKEVNTTLIEEEEEEEEEEEGKSKS